MEKNMDKFLEELASGAPTPGGGGAAAVTGALAAALASMVGNLTVGKEKFAAAEPEIARMLAELEELRSGQLILAAADERVFQGFMAAYRLPHATDEEKAARDAAISQAGKEAASVPMTIMTSARRALACAERLSVIANPGLLSDAACSAILARAAMRAAAASVRANLPFIKDDEDFVRGTEAAIAALLGEAEEMEAATVRNAHLE